MPLCSFQFFLTSFLCLTPSLDFLEEVDAAVTVFLYTLRLSRRGRWLAQAGVATFLSVQGERYFTEPQTQLGSLVPSCEIGSLFLSTLSMCYQGKGINGKNQTEAHRRTLNLDIKIGIFRFIFNMFFFSAGDETEGIMVTKQIFYH